MQDLLIFFCLFWIIDAYGFWIHYAQHHFNWLWKYHEFHHREFSFKFHPMDAFVTYVIPYVTSVILLGPIKPTILLLAILFEGYRGHGGLKWLKIPKAVYTGWNTRGYHKQHHIYGNVNYTQVTKLWDFIMGTQRLRAE